MELGVAEDSRPVDLSNARLPTALILPTDASGIGRLFTPIRGEFILFTRVDVVRQRVVMCLILYFKFGRSLLV